MPTRHSREQVRVRGLATHGSLVRLGESFVETRFGRFRAHLFHDFGSREPMLVVTQGDVTSSEALLSRVHSSCVTSEVLGGCDCDCAHQLEAALDEIAQERRGALFYLMQEGRGAGLIAKARDRMLVQASRHRLSTFEAYAELGLEPDSRAYGAVASAIRILGVRAPLRLMTNNPAKLEELERHKVPVDGTRFLGRVASPFNVHYLDAKQRSGHTLEASRAVHAELPESVERLEPMPLVEAPWLLRVASYLLPVSAERDEAAPQPVWFRLAVYFDLARREERMVLSLDGPRAPLLRFQSDTLLERLPLERSSLRRSWAQSVREMIAQGAGLAVFAAPSLAPLAPVEPDRVDATALTLASSHLGTRPATLLLDPEGDPHELREDLARAGIERAGERRIGH